MEDNFPSVNMVAYGDHMNKIKLSKTDWLKASFRALTKLGPNGIKVEGIAKDLGVSKGSFYWHFENLAALKSNMITHWEELATQTIIIELDKISDNPKIKLEHLILMSTCYWARYDKSINQIVGHVDESRIEYVQTLFQEYGLKKSQSHTSSKLLYSSLIGLQILSHNQQANPQKELFELLKILLNYKAI